MFAEEAWRALIAARRIQLGRVQKTDARRRDRVSTRFGTFTRKNDEIHCLEFSRMNRGEVQIKACESISAMSDLCRADPRNNRNIKPTDFWVAARRTVRTVTQQITRKSVGSTETRFMAAPLSLTVLMRNNILVIAEVNCRETRRRKSAKHGSTLHDLSSTNNYVCISSFYKLPCVTVSNWRM